MFKNISIKNKLIAIILLSLIGLAVLLSYIVIEKSKDTQIKDKFNQLETIEFTKHAELKKYFSTLKNLLTITALNPQTQLIFNEFKVSFNNIQNEININKNDLQKELILDYDINYINKIDFSLEKTQSKKSTKHYLPKNLNGLVAQKIFIKDNPAHIGKKNIMIDNSKYNISYTKNHKKYHPIFNNILKTFNLYDIFLIDLNGDIIYTTFKEKDFATNLIYGPYSDSGLAKVFKKTKFLKQNQIGFEDFSPYEPSYNTPASFISTPIYSNNKITGVLVFQLPAEQLTNIMQFNKNYKKAGLGETGEAYLVGDDYKMRTNSRFIDKLNLQNAKTTIGILKINTKSVQAVMNGDTKRSFHIIKDYRNKDVLSVYHVVHPFNKKDITWVIIAEIDKEEVLLPIQDIKKYMLMATVLILILFLFMSLSLIHNIINKPLSNFQHSVEHFFLFLKGKEKDTKYLEIKSYDEIGKMSDFINQGIKEVKSSINKQNNQKWIKDGIRGLNQLYIESNTLNTISNDTLTYLHKYVNDIQVGVLYLYNHSKEELKLDASYAYDNTNNNKNTYKLHEGIIGQVAYDKSELILNHTIDNQSNLIINSGTKQTTPNYTYTFSLIYNDILYGVMEFASILKVDKNHIEFLRSSSKTIAIAIATAQKNNELKILLAESNNINKDLKQKQDEIENANIKMINQQQQLEMSNLNLEEQQQQLEEANASMEEQQQKLEIQNKELSIAQKEVEQKAKDLELSNKYKTEFMANMSHELRTPLNAVILLSQLMSNNKNKNLTSDDIKKAHTINTAGKDLLRLIDDILDLSKVEAGKIEIIIDEFKPKDLLEELHNLYEQSAINNNIKFNIIDTYKDTIKSDKHRISQILKNLISNALKFTSSGEINVQISKNNDDKLPVLISVKDTGIGIPKNKLTKIFEAFTQADGSTSRQYGGTGLGLSITKELTQLLGGKVSVDSQEEKGSTFSILLPNLDKQINNNTVINNEENIIDSVEKTEQEINIYENNFNEQCDETIMDDIDLTDINILVVDDDIKNIFVLDGILQDYNANVFTAYNGEESIQLLKQNHSIDIILMDIMMPVMDGFEAIKIIRETKGINNIPIIAVTAKTLKEDKDKCLALGANDYVNKPINMESLINIIKVWSEK